MEIEMQVVPTPTTKTEISSIKPDLSSPKIYILPWLTKMEIELQESWGSVEEDESCLGNMHPQYTSLKDIIQLPPGPVEVSHEVCDLGITIRNHLVKRAASAYLQSSPIIERRNKNFVGRLWQKLIMKDQFEGFRRCFAGRIGLFFTCMAQKIRIHGRRVSC